MQVVCTKSNLNLEDEGDWPLWQGTPCEIRVGAENPQNVVPQGIHSLRLKKRMESILVKFYNYLLKNEYFYRGLKSVFCTGFRGGPLAMQLY